MKIVDWSEFSNLPPGTVYQTISPYSTGDLEILGSVWDGGHIVYAGLLPNACGSEVLSLSPEQVSATGIRDGEPVVHTPSGFGRDYGPGRKCRYLVWEQADRERLAGWLLDPAKAGAEMNDDPHVLLRVPE